MVDNSSYVPYFQGYPPISIIRLANQRDNDEIVK